MPRIIEVAIEKVQINPRNQNYHPEEKIVRTMESIRANGGKPDNPIHVHPFAGNNIVELIDGQCRLTAMQRLQVPIVEAYFHDIKDPLEVDKMRVRLNSENLRRMDTWAECRELAGLHQQGMANQDIAKILGMKWAEVWRSVAIGHFPENIINIFRNGQPQLNGKKAEWTKTRAREFLTLRHISRKFKRLQSATDLIQCDYGDIERIVVDINNHKHDLSELPTLIAERRLALEIEYRTTLTSEYKTKLENKDQPSGETDETETNNTLTARHKAELETQLQQKVAELEAYYAERDKKRELGTIKEVDASLNHYQKLCAELDSVVRVLIQGQLHAMDEAHIANFVILTTIQEKKLATVKALMQERIETLNPKNMEASL
jgi:hypothetical protein